MNFLFKIIILFSKLPLKVLYGLSDFIFVITYFVVGYRKDVVFQNLKNSFPEKSDSELKIIRKKFYHNFCDYLVETLKSFTISSHELRVRVQHLNQDVFHEAKKKTKISFFQQGIFSIGNGLTHWQQLFLRKKAFRFTEKFRAVFGNKK